MDDLAQVNREARQGALLRDGMKVVIAGRPNAGKSSLLNAPAGRESAIVTEIAGTTRDVLREHIHLDGMPLHIIDTAGFAGYHRYRGKSVLNAPGLKSNKRIVSCLWSMAPLPTRVTRMTSGRILLIGYQKNLGITVIRNKADLTGEALTVSEENGYAVYPISAKTGLGLDTLREHLKACMGSRARWKAALLPVVAIWMLLSRRHPAWKRRRYNLRSLSGRGVGCRRAAHGTRSLKWRSPAHSARMISLGADFLVVLYR